MSAEGGVVTERVRHRAVRAGGAGAATGHAVRGLRLSQGAVREKISSYEAAGARRGRAVAPGRAAGGGGAADVSGEHVVVELQLLVHLDMIM